MKSQKYFRLNHKVYNRQPLAANILKTALEIQLLKKIINCTLEVTGSNISITVSRMISCVGNGTLGSFSMRTRVGQAMSSDDSCTIPTQERISSTSADLQAFHFGIKSLAALSRSVNGDN